MDIRQRLIELQEQHGWSDYKIAKEAGLSPNTVSNIYRRGNTPSMVTLEALCKAFGITMAQFFAEGEMIEITPELRELFDKWTVLTPEQKTAPLVDIQRYNKVAPPPHASGSMSAIDQICGAEGGDAF